MEECFWCDLCGTKCEESDKESLVYGFQTIELCNYCYELDLLGEGDNKAYDTGTLRSGIIEALLASGKEYEEVAMPKVQQILLQALIDASDSGLD